MNDAARHKQTCAVIIPTADRRDLILRSVRSVLSQEVFPNEIIVIDNGIENAQIPDDMMGYIKLIRTPPRIGPGRSRNIGAQHAQSELIAFLDDDDYWEPAYIKESIAVMQSSGADVVVGQLMRKGTDGVVHPYKLFPSNLLHQRSVYYKNPGFGGQNFMIRRDLFLALNGFDERMPASVDRDLAARILQRGASISVADRAIAVLCDHAGGRVRSSQVVGNRMFIAKHWRYMRPYELARVTLTYARRWFKNKFGR